MSKVMPEYFNGLYREALEKWGIESQLGMVQEECAELIVAINKMLRYGIRDPKRFQDFVEELADVEIMLREIREFPGVQAAIGPIKINKLQRLKDRLAAIPKKT